MSDQEDKTTQGTDDTPDNAPDNTPDKPEASTGAPQNTPAAPDRERDQPRKSSSAIAWLALLLSLALAGGGAWLLPQLQQEKAALADRLSKVEASVGREQDALDELQAQVQRELTSGLGDVAAQLQTETGKLGNSLAALEADLGRQRAELSRFNASDRDDWLMAEAEYLLRLANQRLIMAGDTVAARALLDSADGVLREIDDVRLHDVRAAVAADLAAVRAVPSIDTEGIYLRLAALVEQADALVIFEMPEREARAAVEPAEDWQGRLQQGYEAALQKLADYIIVRRRDVPMQALMDPQWEGLVRQNLRMLLEQAQVALLSGNQTLYRESLERADHWVDQFRDSDEAGAAAMSAEIDQLVAAQVVAQMPDISRSLLALDAAMAQRAEQPTGGEE